MPLPDINLSIRWKLMGAFVLAAISPLIFLLAGVPLGWTTLLSLALGSLLAWYSVFRIFGTIHSLRKMALRLNQSGVRNPSRPYKDELSNLVVAFENFIKSVQDHSQPGKKSEPFPINLLEERQIFEATLATGESVTGQAALLPRTVMEDLEMATEITGKEALDLFRKSLKQVEKKLSQISEGEGEDAEHKKIIEFQQLLLKDESLSSGVEKYILQGMTLPESLQTTFSVFISQLESSPNPYIRARTADCLDLKQRLMESVAKTNLLNVEDHYTALEGKIVFTEQIFPTDIIALHKAGVKGIVAGLGTASSHAEILLESFGISSLSNVPTLPVHLMDNRIVLLDCDNKKLIVNPDEEDVRKMTETKSRLGDKPVLKNPVTLKSGEPVFVYATINNAYSEAAQGLSRGADGVGLFRSEISFIGRHEIPTEEDLLAEYRMLVQTFAGKPVVLRVLDLGGDKLQGVQEEGYREENPCMGMRSTRLLLKKPSLFRLQLRAMLKAASPGTAIIFPMISGWHELKNVFELKNSIVDELRAEGVSLPQVEYGIMVEVPGLVERFEDFVGEMDVFNIGSNDLTQYSLAADRNNRDVAGYYNYAHPALLSMIEKICRLAAPLNKKVTLCGEMASRLDLLPLAIGLGVRHVSASVKLIPGIKALVQDLDLKKCRDLAQKALQLKSTDEVENLLKG